MVWFDWISRAHETKITKYGTTAVNFLSFDHQYLHALWLDDISFSCRTSRSQIWLGDFGPRSMCRLPQLQQHMGIAACQSAKLQVLYDGGSSWGKVSFETVAKKNCSSRRCERKESCLSKSENNLEVKNDDKQVRKTDGKSSLRLISTPYPEWSLKLASKEINKSWWCFGQTNI